MSSRRSRVPNCRSSRNSAMRPRSTCSRSSRGKSERCRRTNVDHLVPKLQLGHALVWEAPASSPPKLELRPQVHSQAGAWERGGLGNEEERGGGHTCLL